MARVLLLEDDPLVLMMLTLELQSEDFEVVQAGTVREAETLLDPSLDVLVCDLDLRGAGDGYVLAAAARLCNPKVAVLYTSGVARPEFAVRAVTRGVLAPKPLLAQEIGRRVRGLLT